MSEDGSNEGQDPPRPVVDEAERLTRLARAAVDENEADAYRDERDELLAEYGYETRVREDDDRDVFVAYPGEWVEDGTVDPTRVEDVDRGIERPLSGTGDPDDWEAVAEQNDELVERVATEHTDVHAENARALADFASNHYAKPVEDLTAAELREFAEEYLPRNGWPSERQLAVVDESIEVTFEKTDVRCPLD